MISEAEQPYKVDLEVFEGPLDLLLHLIKKNDVDIVDIPITLVLEQYMGYLGLLEELNIDLAGDFLLMASELAHIKSKMLLPDQGTEEEEEDSDPRADLIRRLLEYQRYKEAAEALVKRPMLGRDVFTSSKVAEDFEDEEEGPLEVDLFNLISCFYEMLKKVPKTVIHEVHAERVSVTERIYELMDLLRTQTMVEFTRLFENDRTREKLIVTFLAILEMTRLKMLKINQSQNYGEIYLVPSFENAEVQNLEENVTLQ